MFQRKKDDVQEDFASGLDDDCKSSNPLPDKSILDENCAKLWKLYIKEADRYDRDLVENWRDDMDSLLIFAALFSSSISTFVIDRYHSLSQDSSDAQLTILLQMSHQLANTTQTPPASLPPFRPNPQDVAVNTFWFLSLAFSLVCALAAVMVRQWARKYLRQPRACGSLKRRATSRQDVYENMQLWKLEMFVEMIPILLHIALALFFVGLLLFLQMINHHVALFLTWFTAVAFALYAVLTVGPLVFRSFPYKTPFSGLILPTLRFVWKLCLTTAALATACFAYVVEKGTRFFRPYWHKILPSTNFPSPLWPTYILGQVQAVIWQTIPHNLLPHTLRLRFLDSRWQTNLADRTQNILRIFNRLELRGLWGMVAPTGREVYDGEIRAFRWTTLYAIPGREVDMLSIVESIPDFIKSKGEKQSDSYTILQPDLFKATCCIRRSKMSSEISWLLKLCTRNEAVVPSMINIALSSIEALHWMARCPARIRKERPIDPPPDEVDFGGYGSMAILGYRRDQSIPGGLGRSARWVVLGYHGSDVCNIFRCTISAVILSEVYQMERALRPGLSPPSCCVARGFYDTACSVQHHLRLMYGGSRAGTNEAQPSLPAPEASSLEPVLQLCINSLDHKIEECADFRAEFAMWMLQEFHGSIGIDTALRGSIVLRSLCDAATHLPVYPKSTKDHQLAVFRLLDEAFQLSHHISSTSVHDVAVSQLKDTIVGPASNHELNIEGQFISRRKIHSWVFATVKVVGYAGWSFNPLSSDLQVGFSDYSCILGHLAATLRSDSENPSAEQNGTHDDAHADAITAFLQNRLRGDCLSTSVTDAVMTDHIATVRALSQLSKYSSFQMLLRDSAERFGYLGQVQDFCHPAI